MKDTYDTDQTVEEERGLWHYLVIDSAGIRERETANYSKESKRSGAFTRHQEGDIVQVELRRKAGWTKWLRCKTGDGWLFDVSPKDQKVRLVEVEVLYGKWQYQALENNVPILLAPAPGLAKKAANSLGKKKSISANQVTTVIKRIRPVNGKGSYLQLADGVGWVLDFADGKQLLQRVDGPVSRRPMPAPGDDCEYTDDAVPDSQPLQLDNLGKAEFGQWDYIVLDSKGISLREQPSYNAAKNGKRIWEGEIVEVIERRRGDGIAFLKLSSPHQGWAIDGTPGVKSNLRMTEVVLEKGSWSYRVSADKGIDIRSRCSFAADSKTKDKMNKGLLFEVKLRVQVGDSMFLKLKDKDGWAFEARKGCRVLDGPLDIHECPEGTAAKITNKDGIVLYTEPTSEKWAKTSKLVMEGSRVCVHRVFDCSGSKWARVSKPGGDMEGWANASMLQFEADGLATKDGDGAPPVKNAFSAEQVRAAWNAPKANVVK